MEIDGGVDFRDSNIRKKIGIKNSILKLVPTTSIADE